MRRKGAMISGRRVGKLKCTAWLVMFWLAVTSAPAAEETSNGRDTLVYKDGDRVHGALVEQTKEIIVFRSDRFGELRVSASDAVVIKGEKPVAAAAAAPKPAPGAQPTVPVPTPAPSPQGKTETATAAEKAEEERVRIWDRFSPSVLTAKVRNLFGPWHGRLAFSTEVVSDIAERHTTSVEGHLSRKWKVDEVQLNGRFDYADTNDVRTTDLVKGWGQWRHDFNKKLFAQYRPTVEWNRASRRLGVPNKYVSLQQELGAGYNLYTTPSRKLRVGVSQNLFDTWNTSPAADHISRGVVSSFEEAELALPWRITLSQRGVWYPVHGQADGWENRIDLNKKLTETLSTSLRHEIRRHNPDGSSQDYNRLKLLFALDF
jgi:hypothetical protein